MTMDYLFTNQVLVFLFLGLNLLVAYRYAKKRPSLMEDYATVNQSLGVGILTMTLFATLMDSSYIGLKATYGRGVISFIHPFFLSLTAFILGWFFYPKLARFKGTYTMSGIMEEVYGPFARMFTVLISTAFSLLMITSELKSVGYMGGGVHTR